MQFLDFSPPTSPTLEEQRDALQKGLGRAVKWAAAGVLAEEPLLNACLHDQRFDSECEDNRGEWLWTIITTLGVAERFRNPILDALQSVSVEQDAWQLCELGFHFARSGDDEFRTQLYELVGRRRFPNSPEIGEGQLLTLDGEQALLFIARLRAANLVNHDWEWHDSAFVDRAVDDFGEARVRELLTASVDPEIGRFAAGWVASVNRIVDQGSPRQTHMPRMQAISAREVIEAVYSNDKCFWLLGWGRHADEASLEQVLERLWIEQNPAVIVKLLRTFKRRPLPVFDPRLIELVCHFDSDVRRWAFGALGQNSHPLVRAFALAELRKPTLESPIVGLLIKNFEQGDEQRLLEHVELPVDAGYGHWMLMDLIKLLEENESADCSKLGQIVYFHTPCSNCRFFAARLLFKRGNVPAWLADECRTDSEKDSQKLGEPEDGHGNSA